MKIRPGAFVVVAFGAACLIPALNTVFGSAPITKSATSEVKGVKASNKKLHTWISDALVVMEAEGIPGSYDGIHRNVIRESGGNPLICNDWDVNARNGVPSCGLLQVIPPTFEANKLPQSAYDNVGVEADANNRFDPVANIVTACNYAAHRYGSIDNVNGPY